MDFAFFFSYIGLHCSHTTVFSPVLTAIWKISVLAHRWNSWTDVVSFPFCFESHFGLNEGVKVDITRENRLIKTFQKCVFRWSFNFSCNFNKTKRYISHSPIPCKQFTIKCRSEKGMDKRDGRGHKSQTSSSTAALMQCFSTETCRLKSKTNSHKCEAVCAMMEVEAALPSEGDFLFPCWAALPGPLWFGTTSKCK